MTLLARPNLSAQSCAEIRLAPGGCAEGRILALQTAIAEGRYRIDPQAIAARLIAAIDPHFQPIGKH